MAESQQLAEVAVDFVGHYAEVKTAAILSRKQVSKTSLPADSALLRCSSEVEGGQGHTCKAMQWGSSLVLLFLIITGHAGSQGWRDPVTNPQSTRGLLRCSSGV